MDLMSDRIRRYNRLVWSAVRRFRAREMSNSDRWKVSDEELHAAGLVGAWRALSARPGEQDDDVRLGVFVFMAARNAMVDWMRHVGVWRVPCSKHLRYHGERAIDSACYRYLRASARVGSVCGVERARRRRGRIAVPV